MRICSSGRLRALPALNRTTILLTPYLLYMGIVSFFSYLSHTHTRSLSLSQSLTFSITQSLNHSFMHIYMHKHTKKYMNRHALYARTYSGAPAKAGRAEEVGCLYPIDDSLFGNCSGSFRQVILSFQALFKTNGADYTVVFLCDIGCGDSVQTR
jgi:hypothetical protein